MAKKLSALETLTIRSALRLASADCVRFANEIRQRHPKYADEASLRRREHIASSAERDAAEYEALLGKISTDCRINLS